MATAHLAYLLLPVFYFLADWAKANEPLFCPRTNDDKDT